MQSPIEFDTLAEASDNLNMDNETSSAERSVPPAPPPVYSPDIEEKLRICAEQDRSREEIRSRTGTLNIAVDLMRELRDSGE